MACTLVTVGQLVAHVHQPGVEKLRLVNAHHIDLGGEQQDAGRRVNGCRRDGMAVVRHHRLFRIARVDGRFVDFHALMGKLRPLQAAYQFFRLAGEHRATDDFDAPPAPRFLYMVFRKYYHNNKDV